MMAANNSSKPWFAFCSFIAPHHPFEAPRDQIEKYDGNEIPLPGWEEDVGPSCIPELVKNAVNEMNRYPAGVQRSIVQHYLASISLVDDCVGKLVTALEETGQMDNTLILFVADHGEFLGNHGLLRKPSLHYDDLLRVPLILRFPGLEPARIGGMVELPL